MIYHVVLYKLVDGVSDDKVEKIIRDTRSSLLKIPEVLTIKCGKNVDMNSEWQLFIAIDFETKSKLDIFYQDPIYIKFNKDIITKYTKLSKTLSYELDPAKDTKYS